MDQAKLKELLDYNPETGDFHWRCKPKSGRVSVGDRAGSRHNRGYIQVRVDGGHYLAHRLAWLYVYGAIPASLVDHINGNRADNRIANLRLATPSENQQNRRQAHKNSATGYLGVGYVRTRQTRPWIARIKVNGKEKKLGFFSTPERASAAYMAAKREFHSAATVAIEYQSTHGLASGLDQLDWLGKIGVVLNEQDGEWTVTDAHRNKRAATPAELILWKALLEAQL